MPDGVYDAPGYDGNAFDKDVPYNTEADQQPPPQGNNTTHSDDNNNANTSHDTESQSHSTPPHNANNNNHHSTQHNYASSKNNTAGAGADSDGTRTAAGVSDNQEQCTVSYGDNEENKEEDIYAADNLNPFGLPKGYERVTGMKLMDDTYAVLDHLGWFQCA
eukprot:12174759-Ditylum_brightwellii.AAC.1